MVSDPTQFMEGMHYKAQGVMIKGRNIRVASVGVVVVHVSKAVVCMVGTL